MCDRRNCTAGCAHSPSCSWGRRTCPPDRPIVRCRCWTQRPNTETPAPTRSRLSTLQKRRTTEVDDGWRRSSSCNANANTVGIALTEPASERSVLTGFYELAKEWDRLCVWEKERKSVWDGLVGERNRVSEKESDPTSVNRRPGYINASDVYTYIRCAFTRAYYNYITNMYKYIYLFLVVTPICNSRISISSSSSSFKRDLSIPTWWCLPPQPRKLSRCVISHSHIKLQPT